MSIFGRLIFGGSLFGGSVEATGTLVSLSSVNTNAIAGVINVQIDSTQSLSSVDTNVSSGGSLTLTKSLALTGVETTIINGDENAAQSVTKVLTNVATSLQVGSVTAAKSLSINGVSVSGTVNSISTTVAVSTAITNNSTGVSPGNIDAVRGIALPITNVSLSGSTGTVSIDNSNPGQITDGIIVTVISETGTAGYDAAVDGGADPNNRIPAVREMLDTFAVTVGISIPDATINIISAVVQTPVNVVNVAHTGTTVSMSGNIVDVFTDKYYRFRMFDGSLVILDEPDTNTQAIQKYKPDEMPFIVVEYLCVADITTIEGTVRRSFILKQTVNNDWDVGRIKLLELVAEYGGY